MEKLKEIKRRIKNSGPCRWLRREMELLGLWCCGFVAGCLAAIHMDDQQ